MKTALKGLLGLAVLAYVLRSGMIDFSELKTLLSHPTNFLVGLAFLAVITSCVSLRWFLLVRAQGLTLSIKNTLELTMIGNFFNTFMPGAVGGDLIKAWYVAGREPQRKTKAVFTVLLDRIIGLAVFFLFAAASLGIYREILASRLELKLVALSVWSVTGVMTLFVLFFFSPRLVRSSLVQKLLGLVRRNRRGANLLEAIAIYRSHPIAILLALMVSALAITLNIFLFWLQGGWIGIPLEGAHYFFVVPLALVVSAVPLLPGGIGTGQVAFFTLFQWMGLDNPKQGSTLCTAIQIYTITFNCIGSIFYMRFKRNPAVPLNTAQATLE